MKHTEQIEILNFGGKSYIYMRDKLESISHQMGRFYYGVSDASLERLVRVLKNMDLEIVHEGRYIRLLFWRKTPELYSEADWKEREALDEINYEVDQWG